MKSRLTERSARKSVTEFNPALYADMYYVYVLADLIYYEACLSEKNARTRERKLKLYGSAWRGLKQRIGDALR